LWHQQLRLVLTLQWLLKSSSDDNLDSFANYWVLSNKLASLQQQVCHTTTVRVLTRMQLSQPPSMQQQTREQATTIATTPSHTTTHKHRSSHTQLQSCP
jgi:hypothetical protein